MAGIGVWQDCQSLPTRTLHQQFDPHVGKETTAAITPCGLSTLATMPFSPLSVHPHARTVVLFILTHRILSCFGLAHLGEGVVSIVIHIFHREEFGVFPSVYWDLV